MPPSIRGSALKNSSVLEAPLAGLRPARATWRLASIGPLLQPKILIGGVIVLVLLVAGALAPWIAPYDPNAQNLAMVLKPPEWFLGSHALGTDAVGRDILSRLFYGARVSLVIAVMVVLISGVVESDSAPYPAIAPVPSTSRSRSLSRSSGLSRRCCSPLRSWRSSARDSTTSFSPW